jgi:hypothetical protein
MTFNFKVDPNAAEDERFPRIPKDYYACVINEASLCYSKASNDEMVKFELCILNGPFKGRKVWSNMLLTHKNEDVVKRGTNLLSLACLALSIQINNEQDIMKLQNKTLDAKLDSVKKKDSDEWETVVRGYRKLVGIGGAGANARTVRQAVPNVHTEPTFEDDIPF